MNSFGQRVRNERKQLGLTQVEVARLVGTSQGNLSDIENDAVPSSTFTPALANIFGVDAHWLASGEGLRIKRTEPSEAKENALSRKAPTTPDRNPTATKALFDLARELERGDLSPEVQALLARELEAKAKFVRQTWARLKKGKPDA